MVGMYHRKKPPSKSPFVYGLGALARRDYSRHLLRQKMLDRGYCAEEVESALDELTAEGWLDDYRFGAQLCRTLIERGYGPQYIHQAWRQKGVSPDCRPRVVLDDQQYAVLSAMINRAVEAKSSLAEAHSKEDEPVLPDYEASESLSAALARYDDDFWSEQAVQLIQKFTQTRWALAPSENLKSWRRAVSLLERRGYPSQCVRKVLGRPPLVES